jgi:hypothetical protein
MSEIETLTEGGLTVLAALRDASALRREGSTRADGTTRAWTITALAEDGRVLGGDTEDKDGLAALDKAARGLAKKGLVARRTIFTKVYYTLTDEGRDLLARIEAEAGLSALVTAQLEHEQALADLRAANRRVDETRKRLAAERKPFGGAYPWEALMEARRGHPLNRRGEVNA